MSIHGNIFKVMTCVAVIGLAAASGYPAQAQQQNCNPQSGQNCMNTPKVDPNMQPHGAGAYDQPSPEQGSGQVTSQNPQQQQQSKPNSGQ